MTVAADYTSILYSADGQPNLAWNGGIAPTGTPVIVTYSFVEGADLAGWRQTPAMPTMATPR